MKKELKDYLHLYLGQRAGSIERVGTLVGIYDDLNAHIRQDDGNVFTVSLYYEPIRLWLRPLSSMTEEEAKELAHIYTGYRITYVKIKDEQIIFNYLMGDQVDEDVINIGYLNAEGFFYILSKGFDLFNLIEVGLAIEFKE